MRGRSGIRGPLWISEAVTKILAKSPGFVGGHQMSTFRIEGNTLVLTGDMLVAVDGVSPPDFGGSLTLVRIQ